MTTPVTLDPLGPLLELPGVAEAVAGARTAVDRLRAHRAMRRQADVVSAESLRRGAVSGASIETGIALSPVTDQVLLDSDAVVDGARLDAAPAVRGAGRAYGELGALGATWLGSPLQVLARLHLLAARDVLPADQLGRPRTGSQALRPGAFDELLGSAPDPWLVAERLDGLVRLLRETRAPALVVAAVVHAEIATLRPFGWGNHVVALAAQRLVLVGRGLDPRSHAVVEVGHRELGDYGTALQAYASGTPAGVASWIRHCGAAVTAGATEGLAICESLGR